MVMTSLVIALALLGALAALQILVACGLPYGRFVWGGAHRVLPRRLRIGSAVSVLIYAGFAVLLLTRAGAFPGGESGVVIILTWLLFTYFALGVIVNAISRSRVERWTMTPMCAVLAIAALVIALG